MKRLAVAILSCLAISTAWAYDSAARGTVQFPDYSMKKHCTAYKGDDTQLGRYYIGECIFEFNFKSAPAQPINFVDLYNEYTKSNPKFFPPFVAKNCSLNMRRERFSFNNFAPRWTPISNDAIDYQKVQDSNGNNFSLAVSFPADEMSTGNENRMFTAEMVCVGKSRQDLAKQGMPSSQSAETKSAKKS